MSTQTFPSAIPTMCPIKQGKTRDNFKLNRRADVEPLLIVATDRISTHNIVHESLIPKKGYVLNALSIFWIKMVLEANGIPHHLLAYGREVYKYLDGDRRNYTPDIHLRGMVVKRFDPIPYEFIFRSYMTGSLYTLYRQGLDPYGLNLPRGLRLMERFAQPVFTPTEKSDTDDPVEARVVSSGFTKAFNNAKATFNLVQGYLRRKDIELIDSKFEVGGDDETGYAMIDEIATPDSSRFCERKCLLVGSDPPFLDKQIARDEAVRIWNGQHKRPLKFDRTVVNKVSETYLNLFKRITGQSLVGFQQQYLL